MYKRILWAYKTIFQFISLDAWLFLILATFSLRQIERFFTGFSWLYVILILLSATIIVFYIVIDLRGRKKITPEIILVRRKTRLVMILISLFLGGYLFVTIINPGGYYISYVHDETIVTGAALKYLSEGRNPYAEEYFNTPLINWYRNMSIPVGTGKREVFNPAFVTYAYLPGQFIIPFPVYLVITRIFHWYDQRLFYFFCLLIIFFIIYRLTKVERNRLLLLIIFFFAPYFWFFSYYGFNDLQILLFLLLTLYFLKEKRIIWSAIFLGLAIASKQSAIFLLPFYLIYLFKEVYSRNFINILKKLAPPILVIIAITALFIIPFYLWDKQSFVSDVINYQSGRSSTSYPINGWGFAALVYLSHLVNSPVDYYPFFIWQLAIGLPLLAFLIIRQWRRNNLKTLMLNYILFLFVIWFFNRSILTSYLTYLFSFLPVAYFISSDKYNNSNYDKVLKDKIALN